MNRPLAVALLAVTGLASALGNGVNNNGAGGRGRALNGATVADPGDPIDAMASNPAALAELEGSWSLGAISAYANGSYKKRGESASQLRHGGIAPEFAAALPFEHVTLGLAIIPEQLRAVEWRYQDAPGGLGGATSYGARDHSADIVGVRSSLGIGTRLTERLHFGASAGLHYAHIGLDAPYIFQTQPQLRGVKVALDLDTEGFGANGDLGFLYKANERLQFGLRYRSETRLQTSGDAIGNASAQLRSLGIAAPGGFHYDAEVETTLPRSVSAGLAWQARDRLRVLAQTEWINWSDAYDQLTVRLSNGSNRTINSIPASDDVVDFVPLDWEDRFVYRLGLEFQPTEKLWLRAGYSYGKSPIPLGNITALNPATAEHTLSAGVGFLLGDAAVDIAYQYDLPNTTRVSRSNIRSGEYSNSATEIGTHWLGVSVGVNF